MDREDWRATIHGVAKSQTGLSTHTCISLRRFMHTLGNEYPKHHEEAPDADESLGGGSAGIDTGSIPGLGRSHMSQSS